MNKAVLRALRARPVWLLFLCLAFGAARPAMAGAVPDALRAAYGRLDAAYGRRDVAGIVQLYAPGFTRSESGSTEDLAQAWRGLADSFTGVRAIKAVTHLGSLDLSSGHAEAAVARRIDFTLPAPLPDLPPPYFVVEVFLEDWVKTPDGWRLKSMREPPLVGELRRLGGQDQAVRRALIADPKNASLQARERAVDAEDRARIKWIIQKYGWPGFDRAGTAGADIAWGIVQHADDDPAFQKRCLPLIRAAVRRGDARPSDAAYLTDRTLKAEGKPQIYGTQPATDAHGDFAAPPTLDPAHLDRRRASVGLPPMADYLKRMERIYHSHPAPEGRK